MYKPEQFVREYDIFHGDIFYRLDQLVKRFRPEQSKQLVVDLVDKTPVPTQRSQFP